MKGSEVFWYVSRSSSVNIYFFFSFLFLNTITQLFIQIENAWIEKAKKWTLTWMKTEF